MAYEREQVVALAAVTLAARLCEQIRRQQQQLKVMEKLDQSPVTVADLSVQAIVCQAIKAAFPSDLIVAEEDAALLCQPAMNECLELVTNCVRSVVPDTTPEAIIKWIDSGNSQVGSRYWILDPIDGTKGFLRGDQYAIALALIEAGEVQLGLLACPALPIELNQPQKERVVVFVAVRGQGTIQISLTDNSSKLVRMGNAEVPSYLRITESMESRHGNLPLQREIALAVGLNAPPLPMDSQVKYGIVARGEAAVYLRLPRTEFPEYRENAWDHAAGALIVEEAGGRVTDMDGRPLDFTVDSKLIHNRGIIASSSVWYEAVLMAVHQRAN